MELEELVVIFARQTILIIIVLPDLVHLGLFNRFLFRKTSKNHYFILSF
jgi:hypothetical protein